MNPLRGTTSAGVLATLAATALAGCGVAAGPAPGAGGGGGGPGGEVTVTNCTDDVGFPSPARRLFVNDSNLVSMVLALGAEDQVAAVSSLNRDEEVLAEHYGPTVHELPQVSDTYPGLETVVAQRPDVMLAGWGYGYDTSLHLTPDSLADHDIAGYVLTESCRSADGSSRGIVDPWAALRADLTNLGRITGHPRRADEVIADLDRRLASLAEAPEAADPPVLFVFDSGEKAVFTSGSHGAPQAIIEAAGGRNAVADVRDSWTEVSWERLAAARPDAILFVDYPGQTFAQKVRVLRSHPATRDLPAVEQGRFLNLPYAMWTSGPLNIDAAERTRAALERWGLVPSR